MKYSLARSELMTYSEAEGKCRKSETVIVTMEVGDECLNL